MDAGGVHCWAGTGLSPKCSTLSAGPPSQFWGGKQQAKEKLFSQHNCREEIEQVLPRQQNLLQPHSHKVTCTESTYVSPLNNKQGRATCQQPKSMVTVPLCSLPTIMMALTKQKHCIMTSGQRRWQCSHTDGTMCVQVNSCQNRIYMYVSSLEYWTVVCVCARAYAEPPTIVTSQCCFLFIFL